MLTPASRQMSMRRLASFTSLAPQALKNSLPPPNVPVPRVSAGTLKPEWPSFLYSMPRILSGVRQRFVVLVRSVDARADGMVRELERPDLVGIDRCMQPGLERVRRQHERHALVNRRKGSGSGAREDGAAQARLLAGLAPFRQQAGEAHRAAVAPVYIVWALSAWHALPLVPTERRHQATRLAIGVAPHRLGRHVLGARVEAARGRLRPAPPVGNESPAGDHELAPAPDDRHVGRGSDVEVPRKAEPRRAHHAEEALDLGDVRAYVAAAHSSAARTPLRTAASSVGGYSGSV